MTPQTPTGPVRLPRVAWMRVHAVWVFAALVGMGYAGVAALSLTLFSETRGFALLWPAAGSPRGR